jgi:hypothetical protein
MGGDRFRLRPDRSSREHENASLVLLVPEIGENPFVIGKYRGIERCLLRDAHLQIGAPAHEPERQPEDEPGPRRQGPDEIFEQKVGVDEGSVEIDTTGRRTPVG